MDSGLKEPENFSFLGFHNNIVIYIQPAAGLPIQAEGIIGKRPPSSDQVWVIGDRYDQCVKARSIGHNSVVLGPDQRGSG